MRKAWERLPWSATAVIFCIIFVFLTCVSASGFGKPDEIKIAEAKRAYSILANAQRQLSIQCEALGLESENEIVRSVNDLACLLREYAAVRLETYTEEELDALIADMRSAAIALQKTIAALST